MEYIDINVVNEIINKEVEFARNVNPQMAMGMLQVKMLINEYYEQHQI